MASQAAFSAILDVKSDVAHIALTGELDLATAPLLEDRLARMECDSVKVVILDLCDLTFLDSSGLEIFVTARERADRDGHRFELIGASPSTRRLLGLTETEFLLKRSSVAG